MINKHKKIEYVKVYNQTHNIGEIHRIEDGIGVSYQHFKIVNNQEVICEAPEGEVRGIFVPLPENATDFSSFDGNLNMIDMSTGKVIMEIQKSNIVIDDKKTEIRLNESQSEISKEIITKINKLSDYEKDKLIEDIQKTYESIKTLEGKKISNLTINEVEKAIEKIFSDDSDINIGFYKTVNIKEEFGISRFVADRVKHMPQLLKSMELTKEKDSVNNYIISSKTIDSHNNEICLEHRFQATSKEEASKLYDLKKNQLQGVQHKIWMSAWKLANQLGRFTYTCELTKLMKICYPERDAFFSTQEKIEFFGHLRNLENTKIIFSRKIPNSKKIEDLEIRLLDIHSKVRENEHYPHEIRISILNIPAFQNEKMAFVGASYKNQTLELHSDDMQLATWIQTHKSQGKEKSYIKIELSFLFQLAGLEKTAKSNKSQARKMLRGKFQRLVDKEIIPSIPAKFEEMVNLRIR